MNVVITGHRTPHTVIRIPPATRESRMPGGPARTLAALLLAAGLAGASPPLPQTAGVVVRRGTDAPVAGALVSLIDGTGRVLARSVTGRDGRFRIDAEPAGPYSLHVEAIGLRPHRSGPFAPGGETRVELAADRVELAPLPDASGASLCVVRPGPETAVGTVLGEARKALEIEAWARSVNRFQYDVFQYERRLAAGDRIDIERSRLLDAVMSGPSRSRPAAELAEQGYARSTPRGEVLFAPDVDVLLSDRFADGHCYRVIREGQGTGALVGLEFAPAATRSIVDLEGVFWLNPRTAELISLEFRYTGLEGAARTRRAGGGIDFRRLPDGLWTVARWWVRTPAPGGLDQFREEGVEVARVVGPDGAEHPVIGRAGLVGTVRDRAGGQPLDSATVELLGTPYTALTNAEGRFYIPELPPGRFRVTFAAPGRAGQAKAAPRDVWLGASQTTLVDLELAARARPQPDARPAPSAADSIRFYLQSLGIVTTQRVDSLIHDALEAKEAGRLLGRVVDQATGRPVAGVLLSIPVGDLTALTGSDGSFRLGDLPAGRYVMHSQMLGFAERRDTIEVLAGLVIEATVALATQAIALAPITVTVRSRWLDQQGFYTRRTDGLAGHFYTRDDIEKKAPTQFTELLRDVPGVTLIHSQAGMTLIRFRRLHSMTVSEIDAVYGCEPGVYYDGIPMNTSIDRLDMIAVPFVEGIEVYVGAATPIEYQHPCGVILVWTRRPR